MGIVMGYFFCTISFVVFVLEVWEESAGVLNSSIITSSLYLLMYIIFAGSFFRLICLMRKLANLELKNNLKTLILMFITATLIFAIQLVNEVAEIIMTLDTSGNY